MMRSRMGVPPHAVRQPFRGPLRRTRNRSPEDSPVDHIDRTRTCRRTRPHRRNTLAVAVVATTVLTTSCTEVLSDGDNGGGTLESWPQVEVVGSATTAELASNVTVDVHAAMRSDDGLTTLLLDVTNEGNEDTALSDAFAWDGVPGITLYDPASNVEYRPLQIDDDVESGGCLCSDGGLVAAAGEKVTAYVTYADVPADVESVQVRMSKFTPVADVPVLGVGTFGDGTGTPIPTEWDRDMTVAVESVNPTDDGTLVRLRYRNVGSAEPIPVSDFPQPGNLSLVDADGSAIFYPRVSAAENVAGFLDEDDLGDGDSTRAEVLIADVPDDTEAVILRGPGLRRSFPIPVGEQQVTPKIDVPDDLDAEEIYDLHSPTLRYDLDMVPTGKPELPDVAEAGPELPDAGVTDTLTSEAQPGWSVAVRAVVRGPGDFSTLLVDVANDGADSFWPEGLGSTETTDDLGGLTLVDPAGKRLYGAYQSGGYALDDHDFWVDSGETDHRAVAFPALADGVERVTVDVPAFGTVENVPVTDGPAEPEGDIPASLRPGNLDGLRMDVLEVGRMPGGNGTLVRTRLVNESNPGAVTTPFADEGDDDICNMKLVDTATGDAYNALPPCRATSWTADLAEGDQLPFEARFPELPEDVEEVVLYGGHWLPSAPIPVADDAKPWYIAEPSLAEAPEGATYTAREGTSDGFETTTREGDTVVVTLNTDVLFAFDSADLTPEATTRVADLAGDIAETAAGGTVTIAGHTDDVGEDEYNQTLSEQRAEAVRAALEPAVDRGDLTFEVSGSGETDPVAPNEINGRPNPDGQARNRRVTITYQAEEG
jgi:outer membrane protein OmpA-like peptidoglycan-associated protein